MMRVQGAANVEQYDYKAEESFTIPADMTVSAEDRRRSLAAA